MEPTFSRGEVLEREPTGAIHVRSSFGAGEPSVSIYGGWLGLGFGSRVDSARPAESKGSEGPEEVVFVYGVRQHLQVRDVQAAGSFPTIRGSGSVDHAFVEGSAAFHWRRSRRASLSGGLPYDRRYSRLN